jgi:hypothetical protein
MKLPQFTIGEAYSEAAFITSESGHDVAVLKRYLPDDHPHLPTEHHLDDDQWQGVIDTIDAAPRLARACHGLDIPADIAPGAVAALVAAARAGLDYLQRTNPLEHGNPDLGRTWGALEDALAPFSKDLLPPPPSVIYLSI